MGLTSRLQEMRRNKLKLSHEETEIWNMGHSITGLQKVGVMGEGKEGKVEGPFGLKGIIENTTTLIGFDFENKHTFGEIRKGTGLRAIKKLLCFLRHKKDIMGT